MDYYEPRCLHNPNLSTQAVLASDIGDPELSHQMFDIAYLINLDSDKPNSFDVDIRVVSYGGLWLTCHYGDMGTRAHLY